MEKLVGLQISSFATFCKNPHDLNAFFFRQLRNMKFPKLTIFIVLFFIRPLNINAQEPDSLNIYVWEFNKRGGDKNEITASFTDEFETALIELGYCTVLQRRHFARLFDQKQSEKAILSLENVPSSAKKGLKSLQANTIIFGEVYDDLSSGLIKISINFESFEGIIFKKASAYLAKFDQHNPVKRQEAIKELIGKLFTNHQTIQASSFIQEGKDCNGFGAYYKDNLPNCLPLDDGWYNAKFIDADCEISDFKVFVKNKRIRQQHVNSGTYFDHLETLNSSNIKNCRTKARIGEKYYDVYFLEFMEMIHQKPLSFVPQTDSLGLELQIAGNNSDHPFWLIHNRSTRIKGKQFSLKDIKKTRASIGTIRQIDELKLYVSSDSKIFSWRFQQALYSYYFPNVKKIFLNSSSKPQYPDRKEHRKSAKSYNKEQRKSAKPYNKRYSPRYHSFKEAVEYYHRDKLEYQKFSLEWIIKEKKILPSKLTSLNISNIYAGEQLRNMKLTDRNTWISNFSKLFPELDELIYQ